MSLDHEAAHDLLDMLAHAHQILDQRGVDRHSSTEPWDQWRDGVRPLRPRTPRAKPVPTTTPVTTTDPSTRAVFANGGTITRAEYMALNLTRPPTLPVGRHATGTPSGERVA